MYSDEDSDFYGDEATVSELEARVEDFDVPSWWRKQNSSQTPVQIQASKQKDTERLHLHNPYAGVPYAWQLTESVDEFLGRLPPATTDEKGNPWIWICNPYIERKPKAEAQNQKVRGCEDEAPEEEGTDLLRFIEGGMERLHMTSDFIDKYKASGLPKGAITRETIKEVKEATRDILDLATNLRVRCGKWMLFCSTQTVNDVWGVIAHATANNQLGIAAKIAPRSETDQRTYRLICVYTADFGDLGDVTRVASKLKELGLVQPRGKPLYYKPGQLNLFPLFPAKTQK